MSKRIGRRYDALTKYLREVIENKSIGHRVRMAAAMRLSEIFLEHDRAQERKELAIIKAAIKQPEPEINPGDPEQRESSQPDPERALREARAFLESIKRKDGANEQ